MNLAQAARMNSGRLLALAGLLSLYSIACSGESNMSPQPAPIDQRAFDLPRVFDAGPSGPTEKERAAATNCAAALSSPSFAQLAPLLADDVHFAFPGLDDGRGRDAALKWNEELFGAFDGRTFTLSRIFRTPSTQTLEWTMTGTQARAWMGLPPTGRPVAIQGATVLWTRDDGKIVDIHVYFDVAVVKAELGAGTSELASLPMPKPPTGSPEVVDQKDPALEASNVGLVHATLDDIEKSDPGPYLEHFADDVQVYNDEHAQPMQGKAEVKASFFALHRAISSLDSIVDNAWGIDTDVVAEYSLNGTQTGPIAWIPPKADRPVVLRELDIVELRSGKIMRIWRYSNPAQILAAGAVPPPLAAADAAAGPTAAPHRK